MSQPTSEARYGMVRAAKGRPAPVSSNLFRINLNGQWHDKVRRMFNVFRLWPTVNMPTAQCPCSAKQTCDIDYHEAIYEDRFYRYARVDNGHPRPATSCKLEKTRSSENGISNCF